MNDMVVEDQVDPSLGTANEATHEVHECLLGEASVEYHEAQGALVRDRADDVDVEALAGAAYCRGLALQAPGGARLVLGLDASLITPNNFIISVTEEGRIYINKINTLFLNSG